MIFLKTYRNKYKTVYGIPHQTDEEEKLINKTLHSAPNLTSTDTGSSMRSMKSSEVFYALAHPGKAIATKLKQIGVGCDFISPPDKSTIEEFPLLPLDEAAVLLFPPSATEGNGVPAKAWSEADQERMARGEPPQGHPEHPNV